jgi:hypothetical protein
MKHKKALQPACRPGGRLERTRLEISQKKMARQWRYRALKLALMVLLCTLVGISLVVYRMEQNTLWFSHNFPLAQWTSWLNSVKMRVLGF